MEQLKKKKSSFLLERRNGACCLRISMRKSSVCPLLKLSFQQPEQSGGREFLLVKPFGELNVVCKFSCDI